jgi:DNA-binding transcriptional MerR regulator
MESYTTRDVARLLGLSEAQVRSQARAGFLTPDRGPRNSYRFSFQDLVLLRTARELAGARVPPRRIRRALRKLARGMGAGRSLSGLRLTADGNRVIVCEGDATWGAESGQLQIHFTSGALGTPSTRPGRRLAGWPRPPVRPRSASEWFELGENLEDVDPSAAGNAYARAIALDPYCAEAHVNLGRLLQLEGKASQAMEHYRRALRSGKGDPTALFNLGTALEELGRWTEALEAYRRAIRLDPGFADAHFNLARLCDATDRRAEALVHLRAYRQLSEKV